MGNRKVIANYYSDVKSMTALLQKSTEANRFLIGAANQVNGISLANIGDVKHALSRAHESGEILEDILDALESSSQEYLDYCKIKSTIISNNIEAGFVQGEIDAALKSTK